jgi:DNA-directed RNA polymerase subunit H
MAEFVEKVFRSRQTLLGILRDRGYDTTGADKVGPEEIRAALAATPSGKVLEFTLKAVDGAKVPTPYVRVYIMLYVIKHKLQSFLTMLEPTPEGVEEGTQFKDKIGAPADPEKTSVVCLINELDNENKIPEVFYQASVTAWAKNKLRLTFFNMDSFTFDPRKHFMVPKHEIVPPEEHEGLLNSLYVASKKQLPYITYSDMQCRVLGAVPGDIIKITRPSPSSGEYVVYRTVVP